MMIIMKIVGFSMFLLSLVTTASLSDMIIDESSSMTLRATSRKLKDETFGSGSSEGTNGSNEVGLDDYRPIDPSPSSKASLKPGPVPHGTPLNPYIPRPWPSPPPGDVP